MKTLLSLLFLSSTLLANNEIKIEESSRGLTVQIEATNLKLNKSSLSDSYLQVNIPGQFHTVKVGQPRLPVIKIEIPLAQKSVFIESVDFSSARSIKLAKQVEPLQPSLIKLPRPIQDIVKDESYYDLNLNFPTEDARLTYLTKNNGQNVALIEVFSVKYNSKASTLTYFEKIKLNLKSTNPNVTKITSSALSLKGNQLVPAVPEELKKSEKVLFVVSDKFLADSSYLQLKQSKIKRDFLVEEFVVSEKNNTDLQIRDHIRQAYLNDLDLSKLSYVVLVGDVELVASHNTGEHFTDNYYACIDKQDYEGDESFRDIAVGRLPFKTSEELKVYVDKLLKYEANSFLSFDWLKKAAFIATDDRYEVAEGTHNYVIENYGAKLGYTGSFPQAQTMGGDKLYAIAYDATTENLHSSINQGRSFVTYSGHGNITYWVAPHFTQQDIQQLTNTDAYPYVSSYACISGSFANQTEDSFGETWVKSPAGAIGFLGTSNNSYWDEDDIMQKVFFDGYFKDKIVNAGLINNHALEGVRTAYNNSGKTKYYFEIYNLMGDPTVVLK
jgi:hypothetical protein